MFNKNDPLIGAVQEVMKRNHAEREATRLVNEKFGVTDRKAIPHEHQNEWDAAYKQVLTEGVEALDEKINMTQQQMANLDGNPKFTGKDLAHLRAGTHKKKIATGELEESDVTSPSSMGIKKPDYATGTPDYAKPKTQTVNRAEKTSLPAGTLAKTMKEEEQLDEKSPPGRADQVESLKKKFSDKSPFAIAWDSYKKSKKKKMKVDEGFNNRHSLSVNASVEEQVVAEQARARSDYGLGAIPAQKNAAKRRAELDARMEKGIDTVAPFIPGVGAARSIDKYARGQQGLGQTAVDVGLNLAGGPLIKGAQKGISYLRNLRKAAPVAQTTAVAPGASQVANRFRSNAANRQYNVPGAQPITAASNAVRAQQSSQALGGLGKTVNATNAIRAKLSSQALGGFGKVASGAGNLVKNNPKLAAGVAAAAGGAAVLSRGLNNQPPPATAAPRPGPSFEKTGRGNAPSVSTKSTNTQTDLKPANVMSAKPSFEFSDKQREAAKAGKASIKDVESWAKSRGIKANPGSKEILRNYLNAAQNKTMKTDVKAGGTAATPTQTAAQSAEMKFKAGMAQRSGPSVPVKPTASPSPAPNVQPARNSTLAAPSAMAATSSLTRRVGPDGQGGLTVGQGKPAMGMSFTPKTTIDAAKKPASSVTPQMSQSVGSLQQKVSLASNERGFAPRQAQRELTRRQNIQTVKGA